MAASTPAEKFAYNVSEQLERARAMVGESLRLLQTIDPDSQHPGLSDQDPKVAPIDHLTRVVASALAGLFDAHRAEDLSSARQSIRRSMATLGQPLCSHSP